MAYTGRSMRYLGVLALAGCLGGSESGGGVDAPQGPGADAPPAADAAPAGDAAGLPAFRDCRGRAFTPAPDEDWIHSIATPLVTAAGAANHSGQDVIVPPGAAAALPGKFSYGLVSKDLEDERVRVSVDDCTGWRDLGDHLTDTDGRILSAYPTARALHGVSITRLATLRADGVHRVGADLARALLAVGVHEARFQVLGDGSTTTSYLWILPAGTRLAVTDIDGTLTASDRELFQQMLDGSHVPSPYPGAVDLTGAHDDLGHLVLYLTGRPYWLTRKTREWLAALGCAAGPLHVTDSDGEALPTEAGVGDFKKNYLLGLVAQGYVLDLAYGNATTDIYAYLGVGLPAGQVWIIGANAGQQGTHAVSDTWEPRVAEVRLLPPVTQPFSR